MTTRNPLAEAADLYQEYVDLTEISSLAEFAREQEEEDAEVFAPAPFGLVFTA